MLKNGERNRLKKAIHRIKTECITILVTPIKDGNTGHTLLFSKHEKRGDPGGSLR